MAECQTLTPSPSRARSRDSSWGVSAISGTRTIDPRPRAARLGHGPQVDLGLARARHPVQQQRPAVVHRRDRPRPERLGLVAGEGGRLVALGRAAADRLEGPGRGRAGLEVDGPRPRPSAAASAWWCRPPGTGRRRPSRRRRRRAPPPRRGGGGCRGRAPRRARAAVRRGAAPRRRGHQRATRRPAPPQRAVGARRQHQLQAGGGRREVVAGGPAARAPAARPAPAGRRPTPASGARRPSWVAGPRPATTPSTRRGAQRAGDQRTGHGGLVQRGRDRVVEDAVEAARLDQGVDLGGGARSPPPPAAAR